MGKGSLLSLCDVCLCPFCQHLFGVLLQALVVKAVSLAIARDGASGGVVRTVIVCFLSNTDCG